jgi:hypothetical protein
MVKAAEEKVYIVPEINIRVSESWINLIYWCQTQCPHGDIEIKIVNGLPTDLVSWKPRIRFDKSNSIPSDSPLPMPKLSKG